MKWQNLPPALLYPALIPHVIQLCWKYKAPLSIITKSNPIFSYGGLPFVPKKPMFDHFKGFLPYALIVKDMPLDERMRKAIAFTKKVGYPLIVKPNLAHRGVDVHLVASEEELRRLLSKQTWDYLVQEYCDFEFEFGIFYCKMPYEKKGKIVSLTKKIIPILIGNGKDTIEKLILTAAIDNKKAILTKHQGELHTILPKEKRLKTLVCASHCQGAMYFNEKRLITEEVIEKINQISPEDGFYFGRFDVLAKSVEDFKKGNFKIIEVNGATSEFIHIYDSKSTYKEGMKDLKTQWDLLFEISHLNRHRKENSISMKEFIREYMRLFLATKKAVGRLW